jgi:hypothetical protein
MFPDLSQRGETVPLPERTYVARLRKVAENVLSLDPKGPNFELELLACQRRARIALDQLTLSAGNVTNIEIARIRSAEARRARSEEWRSKIRPVIAELRKNGANSYREIAEGLDARGLRPPSGEKWHLSTVRAIEKNV